MWAVVRPISNQKGRGLWLGSEQARPDATVPMRTPYGYAELLAMSQARARAASKIAVAHDLAFLDRNE